MFYVIDTWTDSLDLKSEVGTVKTLPGLGDGKTNPPIRPVGC